MFVIQDSKWQYSTIGLGNNIAPMTRKAITWTNGNAYMRH